MYKNNETNRKKKRQKQHSRYAPRPGISYAYTQQKQSIPTPMQLRNPRYGYTTLERKNYSRNVPP